MDKRSWMSGLLGLVLAAVLGTAWAHNPGADGCPGQGWGGNMGMGPGYGGSGMGPGMMDGGQGMMGGGPGYGSYGLAGLNLNADQQKAINKLMDDHRKRQHDLFGKMADYQARLRDEYQKEKWDADAITKIYGQMSDVRLQMIRSRVDLRNQIYERLTPEQRQQFRNAWVD